MAQGRPAPENREFRRAREAAERLRDRQTGRRVDAIAVVLDRGMEVVARDRQTAHSQVRAAASVGRALAAGMLSAGGVADAGNDAFAAVPEFLGDSAVSAHAPSGANDCGGIGSQGDDGGPVAGVKTPPKPSPQGGGLSQAAPLADGAALASRAVPAAVAEGFADAGASAFFPPAVVANLGAAAETAMAGLTGPEMVRMRREWLMTAHAAQKPPAGDWRNWLLIGGRGSGKTRAGAEWVQALAAGAGRRSDLRIALVAETLGDAREVMIDGLSGIARVARKYRPEVEISRRRLVWPNGVVAQIFSSEDPESLRGPQFHYAWCDELAKWKYAEDTFDMLQFGLRLGQFPRQLVTTTPRPVPVLKRLIADPGTRLVRLSTLSNAQNLAPGFLTALQSRYGGTRLGRQEIDGELIEDREDGLWTRAQLEALVLKGPEAMRRIVVGVDPPAGGANACCGIVVAGLGVSGRAVVLFDGSVEGASPADWARAVVKSFRRFEADRVVAEINQGGDMVAAVLRSVEASLPVSTVRATRGKFLRAEPVAALYEQGRVVHAARFADLEDQMCDFGPDGLLSSGRSPDRLDALVWALTALMLENTGEPRVRGV